MQLCDVPGKFVIAHRYIPGVHMDGPYNKLLMPTGSASNCVAQTDYARDGFRAAVGAAPHIVIVAANYWDIARLRQYDIVSESERSGLPRSVLTSYMANLTTWVRHVKTVFPDSQVVYHTHTVPKHDNVGKLLSWGSYVVSIQQLNAAGKAVARAESIMMLDMADMGSSFTSETLNRDNHHPNAWFSLEVFDQYVSILVDCRKSRFACWARSWMKWMGQRNTKNRF